MINYKRVLVLLLNTSQDPLTWQLYLYSQLYFPPNCRTLDKLFNHAELPSSSNAALVNYDIILITLSSTLAVRVHELTHLNTPGAPQAFNSFPKHLLAFCYLPGKVLDLYLSKIALAAVREWIGVAMDGLKRHLHQGCYNSVKKAATGMEKKEP